MKKYRIYDIVWDDDGDDVELPTEVTMNISIADGMDVDEELGEWLSDEYGYCHFGFNYEIIP